jgi:DNA primase
MLDGDEAGRQATAEILARLAVRMWVRAGMLKEGKQPDQLSNEEVKSLLVKVF